MHQLGNLGNLGLKDAEGVGVGHHHAGNVVAQQGLEVFHIDGAVSGGLHLYYLKAANGCRSGVGAVG